MEIPEYHSRSVCRIRFI